MVRNLSELPITDSTRGLEADEEAQLVSMTQTLTQSLRGNLTEAQRQDVSTCLQVNNSSYMSFIL